jgi:hypothetical protein
VVGFTPVIMPPVLPTLPDCAAPVLAPLPDCAAPVLAAFVSTEGIPSPMGAAPLLVQVTVVVPTGKNEPEGGVQVIVPHVPVDVGAG